MAQQNQTLYGGIVRAVQDGFSFRRRGVSLEQSLDAHAENLGADVAPSVFADFSVKPEEPTLEEGGLHAV